MLYLELGLLPARYIIKLRRILYLQHLLKQKSRNTLIYQIFNAQLQEPDKNDWASTVKKDLFELDIKINFTEIEEMSEATYYKISKEQIRKGAFGFLQKNPAYGRQSIS